MRSIGFIGMGNMAQALAAGFIDSGLVRGEDIFAYAPHQNKLRANAKRLGFTPVSSLVELLTSGEIIIMACKPYQIEGVLSEIKEKLSGKTLISIAAGWNYEKYHKILNDIPVRIQFVMPNTPAMVGEGVILFEEANSLEASEREEMIKLFSSVGLVEELPSNLMGIGGAVAGCAPAFVDMFMEAYADAAVKYGMPRQTAYRIIAQMVSGSGKLAAETGEHPGVLKDNVCSPGGTTICGVAALEESGFRGACIRSVDAIMNK
ncbi:MAG: pyrroline-5-carboxylate reductase [Lachnospiraceae bacterium]|nr:pyrroline-5-carboxylate reductase [Lachnospiraceae bacterium]